MFFRLPYFFLGDVRTIHRCRAVPLGVSSLVIAILMLSLGFASFSLVVQPGLAPSRTVGCAQAGVRLSPLRAGLFDVFKESVRNHTRVRPSGRVFAFATAATKA